MDTHFWHDKWEKNQIGFHQEATNRLLLRFIDRLALAPGARIFLPLCGKTRDIGWLLAQGFRVVGAELSELAVRHLFEEMGVTPDVAADGPLTRYSADGIDVFAGDVFDLTAQRLGPVDAVYDRAAMIALPEGMRRRYVAHVITLTDTAPQLLISIEYDPAELKGPPFSVPPADVRQLYRDAYDLTLLADEEVPGKLKGVCDAKEQAWLFRPAAKG